MVLLHDTDPALFFGPQKEILWESLISSTVALRCFCSVHSYNLEPIEVGFHWSP